MRRSSIFSSDSVIAVTSPWSIFLTRGFAVFLALLLSVELLLRWEAVEAFFPPRPYHSDEVELRRLAMRKVQQTQGRIDVLFLGSSSARTAISPHVFDRVAQQGGRATVSYNGSLSGMTPLLVTFFLQHFYLEQVHPRVVFDAVTLAALKRPAAAAERDRLDDGVLEQAWRGEQPLDSLRAFGMRHSRILYYRGFLGSTFRDLKSVERLGFDSFPMDDRGYEPRQKNVRERDLPGLMTPYGADALVIDHSLDAIRRNASLCRSRGIEYVLVRLPEHARSISGDGGIYRQYRERLSDFARSEGIHYLDVVGDDPAQWGDDQLFNDATHLTVIGAQRFTTLLADAWVAGS